MFVDSVIHTFSIYVGAIKKFSNVFMAAPVHHISSIKIGSLVRLLNFNNVNLSSYDNKLI